MKYINIDRESEKSIKQSEKEKRKLQSQGFQLIHAYLNDRFSTLVYKK